MGDEIETSFNVLPKTKIHFLPWLVQEDQTKAGLFCILFLMCFAAAISGVISYYNGVTRGKLQALEMYAQNPEGIAEAVKILTPTEKEITDGRKE